MSQPNGQSIGDWLGDFFYQILLSGNQANISNIDVNQQALDAGYTAQDLAGVDASAAYQDACSRPGVPAEYKSAPPPPPSSSPEYVVRHIQTTQVTNIDQNFTNIDQSRDVNNILNVDGDVSGGLDFDPVTNTGEGVAAGEDAKVAQVDIDASGGDSSAQGGTSSATGGTATSGDATQTNTANAGDGTGGAGGAGGTSSADGGAGGPGGPGGAGGTSGTGSESEAQKLLNENDPGFGSGSGGDGGPGGAGGAGGTSSADGGYGGDGTGGDAQANNNYNESYASADAYSSADANSQGGDGGPVNLTIDFGDDVEESEPDPTAV